MSLQHRMTSSHLTVDLKGNIFGSFVLASVWKFHFGFRREQLTCTRNLQFAHCQQYLAAAFFFFQKLEIDILFSFLNKIGETFSTFRNLILKIHLKQFVSKVFDANFEHVTFLTHYDVIKRNFTRRCPQKGRRSGYEIR